MIASPRLAQSMSVPQSMEICNSTVTFSPHVKNLGVTLDCHLSMNIQVTNICRSAYIELRRIASIRHFLTAEATKTLVCAFILSKLDYCNLLLAGCPQSLLSKLQMVQNSAARLISKTTRRDHITPVLHDLHWLPVRDRISYKVASITFSCITASCPPYLSALLQLYTPSRQLRSASDTRKLRIPRVKTLTFGQRSFSFQSTACWNSLPECLRHADTKDIFKRNLKTHLFQSTYH